MTVQSEVILVRIFTFLFVLLLGCAGQDAPQEGLTDVQFVDLCVDVLALQTDVAVPIDSLLVAREAIFKKHNIRESDVAAFIAYRKAHPELWAPVLALLKEQLGKQVDVPLRAFQRGRIDSLKQKTAGQ